MMSRLGDLLVDTLSRLLEPNTREVIIGDLAELNFGWFRSVWELCGLIARQQARLWKNWRPWLALLGVVGFVGPRLTFIAGVLMAAPDRYVRAYIKYGVIYQSGLSLTEEFIVWLSLAGALILWSWTAGFAFTSLAGKTALVTGLGLCLVWLGWNILVTGLMLFNSPWSLSLLLIPWLLFFAPATWGARRAFRESDLSRRHAIAFLVVTIGLAVLVTWTSGWQETGLERWSEGTIHGGPPWYQRLLSPLLLSWPAFWIGISKYSDQFLKSKLRRPYL